MTKQQATKRAKSIIRSYEERYISLEQVRKELKRLAKIVRDSERCGGDEYQEMVYGVRRKGE